ncbi:hypothetical protein L3X38_011194 [Prunus dulcis]|uniref:Transposable element protein n=2 Tax=Prunus dulcis TaxID=3755 RepID=A0AAD4WHR7_PRUDU|nr:hypothetical protein L3X38_011194 [Prunus dulcis]
MLSSRAEEKQANIVPPGRKAQSGSCLIEEEKAKIAAFLQNNKDRRRDATSSPSGLPSLKPRIDQLIGFIKEVSYAEWLANVVLVPKKDKGLWSVCVDYTDLDKAFPKDNFPMLRIDQLVDSTSGNQLLSFMDAYFGYNQIMMHEDDKAKTFIIIERAFKGFFDGGAKILRPIDELLPLCHKFDGYAPFQGAFVYPETVGVLRKFMDRYGNLMEIAGITSSFSRSAAFRALGLVLHRMDTMQLLDIIDHKLICWRDAICEAITLGFHVDFLLNLVRSVACALFGARAIHSMKSSLRFDEVKAAADALNLKQRELEVQCRGLHDLLLAQGVSADSAECVVEAAARSFLGASSVLFGHSPYLQVLSVKMVSQQQTKDSGSKKLGMVAPQDKSSKEMKSSKKMKFASSSAETEQTSQTTISDDSKTGRGMSTMPRVVKRKLQKLRPIVEYNKRGKGIGQAHSEMQSYIGVLARSRVPLVDKKWSQIPKDVKEQIWEAVDMAFVVGQGGKKSVLTSAAKKWKDFKSTLTRDYILPYTNDKEKLSHPPETYKFIEKAQWDAFVASRLSKDFESVHSQHAQIREKFEYNHRLSRKGYAGLEDQLEETMPGVEIDRSTLWKRARQDKHGNIPDPKVAEKAKLIDELQKQVSEGKVRVDGSKDVLTMALGPEHPGRLRGVGAGISPRQYFNLPKPQRVSFDDRLKESLRVLLQEETNKMEAKAKEEALRMEARTKQLVEAEREHFLSQLSQLIPNFDPGMLKQRISQSPKNPMCDKASCSGGEVKSLHYEDDNAKNGEHQQEEEKEEEKRDEEKEEEKEKKDEEKHDDKLLKLEVFGGDRDTFLLHEDITQFAGMEEIGATVVAVYMRYLHDVLKQANMCSMVGFIDPATVSANSGTIAERSRLVAAPLQKTDGEQIFMMPYNPGLVSLGFCFYDFQ